MKEPFRHAIKIGLTAVSLLLYCAVHVRTQVPHSATDPNGVAIPYPLVHLVHSTDPKRPGATAHLRAYDPFLLYQLGRDLVNRRFTLEEGAFGRSGELSVPLYSGAAVGKATHGADARFGRDHASSCGNCHSMPFREPGGGQTIASTSGRGRNTTHFYGAGLVEMLGEQVRLQLLDLYDRNRNGVFDRGEVSAPSPALIRPAPGAAAVDYGDLRPGADGVPRLNPVFRCWYLDASGRVVPDALDMNDPRVAAFDVAMQPFGWGRGYRTLPDGRRVAEGAEAGTLRTIFTLAADVHLGLQTYDPTQHSAAAGASHVGGLARRSLSGAQQYDFTATGDHGRSQTATGISLDDPDGDGRVNELTEGDVDAAEFYMLHAPAPAVRATAESERGRQVLSRIGCTRCHVETWRIEPRDPAKGFAGDRRLFSVGTASRPDREGVPQLTGTLVMLSRRNGDGALEPLGRAARVERVYSDFKHWDIGEGFHELRFDGSLQREHRTAPLWGVGSTAPYGHAGRYQTLDEAVLAHGGAAAREREAYAALRPEARRLLIAYLRSLVLYQTDEIPSDVDGDGRVAAEYMVAGQGVGFERFDARYLFAVKPRYRIFREVKDAAGRPVALALISNVAQTYRLDLPFRRDADGDSFPDVVDPFPSRKGVR